MSTCITSPSLSHIEYTALAVICQPGKPGWFATGGCSVSQCRVLRRGRRGSVLVYSTPPTQEQGPRLAAMHHRSKDFSQELGQYQQNPVNI